jgi:hypothetical protein
VDHNRPATDRLVHAIVVDYGFVFKSIFLPDLDPEGVWLAGASSEHELVVAFAVDRAGLLF